MTAPRYERQKDLAARLCAAGYPGDLKAAQNLVAQWALHGRLPPASATVGGSPLWTPRQAAHWVRSPWVRERLRYIQERHDRDNSRVVRATPEGSPEGGEATRQARSSGVGEMAPSGAIVPDGGDGMNEEES